MEQVDWRMVTLIAIVVTLTCQDGSTYADD